MKFVCGKSALDCIFSAHWACQCFCFIDGLSLRVSSYRSAKKAFRVKVRTTSRLWLITGTYAARGPLWDIDAGVPY